MSIDNASRRTVLATVLATVIGVLLASGAACGGDSPTAPETISGTFTLRSFNDAPLPVVLTTGTATLSLVGDTLVLNRNHTYRTAVVLDETIGGQTTTTVEEASGTYVRSGSSLTLTDTSDGSTVTGVIQGETIVITDQADRYVFGV